LGYKLKRNNVKTGKKIEMRKAFCLFVCLELLCFQLLWFSRGYLGAFVFGVVGADLILVLGAPIPSCFCPLGTTCFCMSWSGAAFSFFPFLFFGFLET
jgi:hypothetical protein